MANELENNYDQGFLLNPQDLKIFTDVDEIISSSLIQGDPRPALWFGSKMRREGQIRGLALSKLLFELDRHWEMFQSGGMDERIEDLVFVEMGISPQTTRKYIGLWGDLFENPDIEDDIKRKLMGKSIQSLLLLKAAARDGDDIDWDAVAGAESGAEIRDLVRGVRGPTTSSESAVTIFLDREGSLYARRGSNPDKFPIGRLFIDDMEDSTVAKAINRLVERGGVIWL